MAATKQQGEWDDDIKITMPPPAYSHHPRQSFSSPPPPCYDHYGDSTKVKSKLDNEESWSVIMQRPFYQRWAYLLQSWGQVLRQGIMSNYKRLQISESKLNHILEYNKKLEEQLDLPTIAISEASESIIRYCNSTKDPFLPSIWGKLEKEEDPFIPHSTGCCTIL